MLFITSAIVLSILLEIIGVVLIIFENVTARKRRGVFFLALGFFIQILLVIVIYI